VSSAIPEARRRVVLVDRPGAPQSEIRVGQPGPPRSTADYHALVTLNALLGGQFTSRINRNLREQRGITYGARTSFDFRRVGGAFACDTSVQADATGVAVTEILREFEAVRQTGAVTPEEIAQAKASLTRGYPRGFETARQIARAAATLVIHQLPSDTFDRFVPGVEAIHEADLADAASRVLLPDSCSIVVVGDGVHAAALEPFGDVERLEPEF
jgi:predicted Zn-dependent peptidase